MGPHNEYAFVMEIRAGAKKVVRAPERILSFCMRLIVFKFTFFCLLGVKEK